MFNVMSRKHFRCSQFVKRIIAIEVQLYFLGLQRFYLLPGGGGGGGALECNMTGEVKSVQSALKDLLTTSATHGTFSRPSTKHGLILIGLELNTNATESFEHC